MLRRLAVAFVSLVLTTVLSGAAAGPAHYRVTQRFHLGGEGGWDYLVADHASKRLFVSRGTRVLVLDLDTGGQVGEIPGTPGVHGIALAPEVRRGFTSNGADSSVTVFDLQTLAPLARIHLDGRNPDAILYEPATRRVFAMNAGSGTATAIDAASGTLLGTVALGGQPEFAVADGEGRVFVNLEDSSAVVAFDARTLRVEARWPLAPGEGPTGLALDRERHRLFSVCGNERMIVLDSRDGRVIAALPIGRRVDGAAFDPATRLAFSSNGEGTVTVVHEDDAEHFRVVETVETRRSARTVALDPVAHRLYLPAAQFGEAPAPTADHPRPRPPMIPGSFEILVLERGSGVAVGRH